MVLNKEVRIIRINRLATLGVTIAVVTLVGISITHSHTTAAKIDYLQQQIQLEQNNKRNLELKKQEVEKKNTELDQARQQLEKDKADQQKQIDDLNSQLQARIAEKARIAAVKVQEAVLPVAYAAESYPASGNSAKAFIYEHESGNNPGSINQSSGACGLGQALPCSKMGCSLSDYACQDAYFTGYAMNRYGSWENAQAFWIANKWW